MKRPWVLKPPKTEEESFKLVQFQLSFLGCWTASDKNRNWTFLRGVVNNLINSIAVIGQYAFAVVYRNNLVLVLDCMCPATTMGATSFKLFLLQMRNEELTGIFKTVKEAFKTGLKVIWSSRHLLMLILVWVQKSKRKEHGFANGFRWKASIGQSFF